MEGVDERERKCGGRGRIRVTMKPHIMPIHSQSVTTAEDTHHCGPQCSQHTHYLSRSVSKINVTPFMFGFRESN